MNIFGVVAERVNNYRCSKLLLIRNEPLGLYLFYWWWKLHVMVTDVAMESRVVYCWAMGISFSPSMAGRGASTVSTPSLLRDDLILSGFVPLGSMNSRLYSRYTDLLSVFSSCLAWTRSLLSTVFTTISSGWYWLTSNRNFSSLLSPSSWISGELKPSSQVRTSPFCAPPSVVVVLWLCSLWKNLILWSWVRTGIEPFPPPSSSSQHRTVLGCC